MSWLLTGVLSVVIVGMARPAAAQDAPKVEVAGGWNYFASRSNATNSWEHFYKGGFGDVAVAVNERWSVVGNVGYLQKTITEVSGDIKFKVAPYLFGLRMSHRANAEVNTPFLQFLAGATSLRASGSGFSETETNFTWSAGGGINIVANGPLFARVMGDYVRIHGKDGGQISGGEAIQGLRLSVGVGVGF